MKQTSIIAAVIFAVFLMVAGCGKDSEVHIPQYPESEAEQSMNMGSVAKVERFFTYDSYEDVIAFYEDELSEYEPDIQSFEARGSRQTKIDVVNEKRKVVTVVVQEFEGEDRVAIVFMGVSL